MATKKKITPILGEFFPFTITWAFFTARSSLREGEHFLSAACAVGPTAEPEGEGLLGLISLLCTAEGSLLQPGLCSTYQHTGWAFLGKSSSFPCPNCKQPSTDSGHLQHIKCAALRQRPFAPAQVPGVKTPLTGTKPVQKLQSAGTKPVQRHESGE